MPTSFPDLLPRRSRLAESLRVLRADAFVITALPNVQYLSGFTGSNGALLLTAERAILFTDPRYQTQAPLESDCEVRIAKGPLSGDIAALVKRMRLRVLAFEENRISFSEYNRLTSLLPHLKWKPVSGAVEHLRAVKSDTEIATIKASVLLNSKALEDALAQFSPDMTESDLAGAIEYRMRTLGADGTAFDTIVASGERSALPHAKPSERAIEGNQLLLIDMGSRVSGYCSDMTRTHAVGKLKPKMRRMYRAVLESQLAAIEAVKPGVSCAKLDKAARTVLSGYGMDEFFIHSTGHGLGLEIHEEPRVGRKEKTKLEPGMVITIEPGVYIEGAGGVRIEDTVVVTRSGCDVLTPTTKDLVQL
jgi:Xaa-Pro aminopeptidase